MPSQNVPADGANQKESQFITTDIQATAGVNSAPVLMMSVAAPAGLNANEHVTADQFVYRVNGDDATCEVLGYEGELTDLTIPSVMDGYTVTSIAAGAFEGCSFNSVSIPSSVSAVGEGAFGGCNIAHVNVPSWGHYWMMHDSEGSSSYGITRCIS